MSLNYDQWVLMQEEPGWNYGPYGRPAKPATHNWIDPDYVPFKLSRIDQLRIEDEIIARHIEDHEG